MSRASDMGHLAKSHLPKESEWIYKGTPRHAMAEELLASDGKDGGPERTIIQCSCRRGIHKVFTHWRGEGSWKSVHREVA